MGFLSDYMPKPDPKEPTTEDIIDFYCRFGNKKNDGRTILHYSERVKCYFKGCKNKER